MIQEIITFIIVGAAVVLAISKAIKKMSVKKKSVKKVDFKKDTIKMQHNCSDCSAECMLRNSIKPVTEDNNELCKSIEIKRI